MTDDYPLDAWNREVADILQPVIEAVVKPIGERLAREQASFEALHPRTSPTREQLHRD